MKCDSQTVILRDFNAIESYFESKSEIMSNYLKEHKKSEFTLICKKITYADLLTKAKRKHKEDSFDLDILLYLNTLELEDIGAKNIGISKQSNINMPPIFFEKLGIEKLTRREGKQSENHKHVCVNDFAKVYLVNESYKYFDPYYTFQICDKLTKKIKWKKQDIEIKLNEGLFTEMELHHAIHGIGTKEDDVFYRIRHSLFRNDGFTCLIENDGTTKKVYVYLEKNIRFFTLLNLVNENWANYLQKEETKLLTRAKNYNINLTIYEEEKNRKHQSKWRQLLADEVMNFTTHENEVFCMFTMITADYNSLGTIFRASHIKRFEHCNKDEAFDINNGILLCANADALFDKFMISIDENKELIFSYLIKDNYILKQQLCLDRPIFKMLLNEKRMEYVKWHREEFYKKEKERKITQSNTKEGI